MAGNAYSQFEPKHLSNLIFPAGSYIIATEPLADGVAKSINRKDVAVCDLNDVCRLLPTVRPTSVCCSAGACNYSGRDPKSIKSYILPRMLKVYPQLENVKIEYEWGGKIGVVLRRIPTLGRN